MKTHLTIRVQAKGGMFLGPDSFGGAVITVSDLKTGKVLANGMTDTGDSGSQESSYVPGATDTPIITPGKPEASLTWVVASASTVKFAADLDLEAPTLVKVSAGIPLPPAQGDQEVSVTTWLLPGQKGPSLVLEVPGLWVQPELVFDGLNLRIRAKVTMMCGCEVNESSPWLPEDFSVHTVLVSGKQRKEIPMEFEINSQYSSAVIPLKAGDHRVEVLAAQKSLANYGVGIVGLKV